MASAASPVACTDALRACATAPEPSSGSCRPRLLPLALWFRTSPGPLLPQLRQALRQEALRLAGEGGEPLRWAVTAVDPARGLRLEGIVVGRAGESAR